MRLSFWTLIPAVLAAPLAPIAHLHEKRQEDIIPGKWLVHFENAASSRLLQDTTGSITAIIDTEPEHTYDFGDFKGVAISATDEQLNAVRALGGISAVEPDSMVYTTVSQANPPYGLARISHRTRGATTYDYDESAGAGTYSYIIDTGIRITHSQFGGRATWGANYADSSNTDGNGHGTHVAGTTGGSTYGVAKNTNLIAVKVLGNSGSGTLSGVISGIQWAVNDATSKGRIGKAVANLSLGSGYSSTVNQAATAAVNAGLFLAVAAGNDNSDASASSPASTPAVCTVGATDSTDARASFSNFGSLVDIFAPGVGTLSAWYTSDTATNTISGTSMATPHITGLGAYILGLEGSQTPAALCARLRALATPSVTGAGTGSPNLLAFNGYTA